MSPLPRHALTLCASLVENPANLGGLCRTAEAWRLQRLVIASDHWLKDWTFQKVAVSTGRWQPIEVCACDRLTDWIQAQQRQHLSIVALTRHPQATPLHVFQFPRQSVLLLGRELTGIPHDLIQQCNAIVEIPQYGQVNSLNVSTAAAIAAYAYLCQHPLPPHFSAPNG